MKDVSEERVCIAEPVEVIDATEMTVEDATRLWESRVWQRCQSRCANCGEEQRLKVRMIVPLAAGGQLRPSNGILLCRACEMAGEAVQDRPGRSKRDTEPRPINFYVSRGLSGRVAHGLKTRNGFHTKASLVRYLMRKYVEDESRFDDLEAYQDDGSHTKINVWVDGVLYRSFKQRVNNRGMTVTQALKGLITMYGSQVEPLVSEKR